MNYYIGVISDTVDYIEENITEKLTLGTLAKQFGISDFHFNRIFKAVTGMTLKQYILGRKLTIAADLIQKMDSSILDISLHLGFEYPEVFSRAFKKQFGIAPTKLREGAVTVEGVPKAGIVDRDIMNYKGTLSVKGSKVYLEEYVLAGIRLELNVYQEDFRHSLQSQSEGYFMKSSEDSTLQQDRFFTVVSCHGDDSGDYSIFCARELMSGSKPSDYSTMTIPKGWYAKFEYQGNMFDIQGPLMDDLYRWIMVNDEKLNNIGIGMIDIYHKDYPTNDSVTILFPIQE
jgi:AraC family transcriptional regulator